jgi:hypothetical protein
MNSKLVLNAIEDFSGFNIVNNRSRKSEIVEAKQLYSKIMRDYGYTYEYIGKTIGFDHATILHHYNVYEYVKMASSRLKEMEKEVLNRLNMSNAEILRYKISELKEKLEVLENDLSHSTDEKVYVNPCLLEK